jgi:hypothetical protein
VSDTGVGGPDWRSWGGWGSLKWSSVVVDLSGGETNGEEVVRWLLVGFVGPSGTAARRWSSGGWKGIGSMPGGGAQG